MMNVGSLSDISSLTNYDQLQSNMPPSINLKEW